MSISAELVISAASEADFPRGGAAEIALVGRSNVGKSSLINALVRRKVARTSAAPGKTRLANVYQVVRGAWSRFYLVDLPGYGFAVGDRRELDQVTKAYFDRLARSGRRSPGRGRPSEPPREPGPRVSALLVVDARHPGLEADIEAWRWLGIRVGRGAIVATKIDKLARGQRIRTQRELESVFDDPVLPVSAATGEGLDELWKLIDQLAHTRDPKAPPLSSRRPPPSPPPLPRR